ncbi:MAG: DUF4149 domain-containing protein [Burkholderiaceae bacterium]
MRTRLLITALWVGGGWVIGYLVVPTLFFFLPTTAQAGDMAGHLFRLYAQVSFVCGGLLLLLLRLAARANQVQVRQYRGQVGLVILMLFCTAIVYFGLQPTMNVWRLEAHQAGVTINLMHSYFGWLHAAANLLFLVQGLAGVLLLLRTR